MTVPGFLRRRRELVCREAVALIAAYVDGSLGGRDRARLERHLSGCRHCSEYLEQVRATMQLLGRVEADDLGDDAVDELVDLYRRWRAE